MISEKKEKNILKLSFFAGLMFAVVEVFYSIFSHSQSVLMDAVYDATELIFIALILYLTPLFYKPISEKHPYGYFQIESIFLIIKGFMMLAVTVSVSVEIVEAAFSGGNSVNGVQIAVFQIVLAMISLIIYTVMSKMNRSVSSPTVHAELLGWKMDILYSLGMALAFFASTLLERTRLAGLAPYTDPLIAVGVIVLTLPENIRILWSAIKDVFLFPPDEETMDRIKEISGEIMRRYEFEPVFYDITKTGRHLWVCVYFKIPEPALAVEKLKTVTGLVSEKVKSEFDNCTCELILAAKS